MVWSQIFYNKFFTKSICKNCRLWRLPAKDIVFDIFSFPNHSHHLHEASWIDCSEHEAVRHAPRSFGSLTFRRWLPSVYQSPPLGLPGPTNHTFILTYCTIAWNGRAGLHENRWIDGNQRCPCPINYEHLISEDPTTWHPFQKSLWRGDEWQTWRGTTDLLSWLPNKIKRGDGGWLGPMNAARYVLTSSNLLWPAFLAPPTHRVSQIGQKFHWFWPTLPPLPSSSLPKRQNFTTSTLWLLRTLVR